MDGDDSQAAGGSWQFKPGDSTQADIKGSESPKVSVKQKQESTPTGLPATVSDAAVDEGSHMPSTDVTWTASEFIPHQKSIGWYLALMLAAAALAAVVYALTRDKISTGVVIFAAIIFGIYGARKPRKFAYKLDDRGLNIGEKVYDYSQFRSFAIVQEGSFSSIVFMPLKRFMPLLTVYFEPADEDEIVEKLSDYLPMDNKDLDLVDRFLHHIRF